MMKELTQEQVNELGERMRNAAGNAAESSLPLMLRDLGKQIAESGDNRLEATLKIGLEINDGEWVISTAMEWTRKMKHKDAFDDVRVNFEQPELPLENDPPRAGKADAIDTTARKLDAGEPVRMLEASTNMDELCSCGHQKREHDDGYGMCDHGTCCCSRFVASEHPDPDFHMKDEADAAQARDARNARKLAAKGIAAAYLGDDEKTVFQLNEHTGFFVESVQKTKAAAKRRLDELCVRAVNFKTLTRYFEKLDRAGFLMIVRADEENLRIKYTDMSYNWATLAKYKTRDEMAAALAGLMADPLVLED